MTVEEMNQRLADLPTELKQAEKDARREHGRAAFEGNQPDPAVVNRPAELKAELENLPWDIYKQRAAGQHRQLDSLRTTLQETVDALPAAKDRLAQAQAAKELADAEYEAAYREQDGLKARGRGIDEKIRLKQAFLNYLFDVGVDANLTETDLFRSPTGLNQYFPKRDTPRSLM